MSAMKFSVLHVFLLLLTFSPLAILALPTADVLDAGAAAIEGARNDTLAARQRSQIIDCIPTGKSSECEIRVSQYSFASYATINVFDSNCVEIDGGANYITLGAHASITSELPWTIELDLSTNWSIMPTGFYAGQVIGTDINEKYNQKKVCAGLPGPITGRMIACILPFTCII